MKKQKPKKENLFPESKTFKMRYVYDFNMYSGKDVTKLKSSLEKRAVKK